MMQFCNFWTVTLVYVWSSTHIEVMMPALALAHFPLHWLAKMVCKKLRSWYCILFEEGCNLHCCNWASSCRGSSSRRFESDVLCTKYCFESKFRCIIPIKGQYSTIQNYILGLLRQTRSRIWSLLGEANSEQERWTLQAMHQMILSCVMSGACRAHVDMEGLHKDEGCDRSLVILASNFCCQRGTVGRSHPSCAGHPQ